MGHASSIALGIATAKPSRYVVCLDGDGATRPFLLAVARCFAAAGGTGTMGGRGSHPALK